MRKIGSREVWGCGGGVDNKRGVAHLDKGVDVADGGDVVGDEGAHLRLELDVVRLVPRNVLEEL